MFLLFLLCEYSNQRVVRTTLSTLVSRDFPTIHTLFLYITFVIMSRKHASLYLIPLQHFSFAKPNQG